MRRSIGAAQALWALVSLSIALVGEPRLGYAADTGPDRSGTVVPVRTLLASSDELSGWVSRRHPDVAAARARIQQAEAGVSQARALLNPVLGVTVGGILVGPSNPSGLRTGDTMNVTVGLSETFELGKRGPRARAASLRRDASRASHLDVLADHVGDARDALARVVYFTERQRVLEERLKSAQDVANLATVRLQHGDISGIDQDRLRLESTVVSRELSDNSGEREAALADCAALLFGNCVPSDADMDAVDAAAPLPEKLPSFDDLVQKRPDLRAVRLSSAAASEDAVYYRRRAIPDPTVGVNYTRDFLVAAGNQPHTLAASVGIPLPFFDHGQHLARQSESEAAALTQSANAIQYRALTEARALLVRKAVLESKLRSLTESALPLSTGVLKSSEDAYRHGQLSLTDLLLVRREHASLLLDNLDTRYELFAIRNTLYRTLGLSAAFGSAPVSN